MDTKKILITCGPTWVPIDDMRVISNKSTGELGQTLAKDCVHQGFAVTLLEGPVEKPLEVESDINIIKFKYYDEFCSLLENELKNNYNCVIHAAAVSDYKMKNTHQEKISSTLNEVKLELKPTEKLIQKIKKIDANTFLVGFKLESQMSSELALQKTQSLFTDSHCDLVIANIADKNNYTAYILDKNKNIVSTHADRQNLSQALVSLLKERL